MTNELKDQPETVDATSQQRVVLRLFAATDYTDDCGCWSEECWWIGVWAESKEQALSFARDRYTESDEIDSVSIQCEESAEGWQPDSWPSEERRCEVLREIGFRSEGESSCEICELYACDLAEFSVCQDCCRCAKCAAEESEYGKCENCGL